MAAFKIGSFNLIPGFIATTVWCVHWSLRLLLRGGVPCAAASFPLAMSPANRVSPSLRRRSIAGIGALPYGAKWLLNGEVRCPCL